MSKTAELVNDVVARILDLAYPERRSADDQAEGDRRLAALDMVVTVDAAAKAAARALMSAVLDTLQADPHQWSERPCPTCRAVSALAGRDFGCQLFAKKRARPAPTSIPPDGEPRE